MRTKTINDIQGVMEKYIHSLSTAMTIMAPVLYTILIIRASQLVKNSTSLIHILITRGSEHFIKVNSIIKNIYYKGFSI